MSQGQRPLSEIRDRIDSLDKNIQELLNERAALAAAVAVAKAGETVKIRPAREAQILRRLIDRQDGEFPKQNMLRIWREIFSAMLRLEGSFSLAVYQPSDSPGYWDLARDQFGSFTPITGHQTPRRVIEAITRDEATLGVLPTPADTSAQDGSWWRNLAIGPVAGDQQAPKVVGMLPFFGPGNARARNIDAMVIARLEPEASGDDQTWIVLEISQDLSIERLRGYLDGAGFEGRFLGKQPEAGPPNRWSHLIEVAGFYEATDTKLGRLADALGDAHSQTWVIGAYATPFDADQLATPAASHTNEPVTS